MQMIGKSKFEINKISGVQHTAPAPCVFCIEEYVEHLVGIAQGRVGSDSEKTAILKSALTCAHERVLKHGAIMAWPEMWEGQILKELERLVGKARFPRWASQNLPFMSAKIRRSRIKLVTEVDLGGRAVQEEVDQEQIDGNSFEVAAKQDTNLTPDNSQKRSDMMECIDYLTKIQEILADQAQNEQVKFDNILKLLRKDLSAHMYFPPRWLKDHPATVQALRQDLKKGFDWKVNYYGA